MLSLSGLACHLSSDGIGESWTNACRRQVTVMPPATAIPDKVEFPSPDLLIAIRQSRPLRCRHTTTAVLVEEFLEYKGVVGEELPV